MSESETGDKQDIAHIHASFNNILITVTDITSAEIIVKSSSSSVVKQNHDEASPYTAIQTAESATDQIKVAGVAGLHVRIHDPGGNDNKNPGPDTQATIHALARAGLEIGHIGDATPISHDGTRVPKNG